MIGSRGAGVMFVCVLALTLGMVRGTGQAAEVEPVRVLFDFETAEDMTAIAQGAESVLFEPSQDSGVTRGKRCCRMTFPRGGGYRTIAFQGAKKEGWDAYDYFAMDINAAGADRTNLMLEFWDELTRDYYTRCTHVAQVVPGRQTVLIRINRSKRNNKEGRDWEELEPRDRIRMDALKVCKLFLVSPKDHDLVWWVDSIRLVKEEALGRTMRVELPAGARAFRFGKGPDLPGFETLGATAGFDGAKGFTKNGTLENAGQSWPDPLTGNGVYSPAGDPFTFDVKLDNGEYLLWVAAGMVLRDRTTAPHFLLKVEDDVLADESPTLADYYGERYLFRFLRTPYSERENALWEDFVSRMYPTHTIKVGVADGVLSVQAANYLLSALVILPAARQSDFEKMTAAIDAERLRLFQTQQPARTVTMPAPEAGDGSFVSFIPDDRRRIAPDTAPTAAERARKAYDLAAAPGQNVILRLAITPFGNPGSCSVSVSDIAGPATLSAQAVRWYYQDFRLRGIDVVESALIPTAEAPLERGVTRCFWAWWRVPEDAPAGAYTGTVTAAVPGHESQRFPLTLIVYPFRIERDLPYSFGMWYRAYPMPDRAEHRRVIREQLEFMTEIGFTGVEVPGPNAEGTMDSFMMGLAREAGMGRNALQMSQTSALGMGRSIARRKLGLGAQVDRQPGCEFGHAGFRGLYVGAARRVAAFLEAEGFPMAVQSVDEPRETPNPWNRNLEQTNLYADYLREAGVGNVFVTPMGDANHGKDYTSLVDHHDIIATHAGKASERLMILTPQRGKTLWLYNCGMDRLSWGFYNWRVGSRGRWEWHFQWRDGGGLRGYLNDEWYNPFTSLDAAAPRAPYATHAGAMLFKSRFLMCAEGITDTAYIVTLERTIERAAAVPAKAETAAQARAFLDALRAAIPFLPEVKGLVGPGAGALVGEGIEADAAALCERWRRRIAEFLIALQ